MHEDDVIESSNDDLLDREADALPVETKRAIHAAGMDALMILLMLDAMQTSRIIGGSRVGVLRYWMRVVRRETVFI